MYPVPLYLLVNIILCNDRILIIDNLFMMTIFHYITFILLFFGNLAIIFIHLSSVQCPLGGQTFQSASVFL